MAKIRTAAARKYHQTDSESNNSDDVASVAKSPKSKPGPKSSKRKSERNSNGSSETPRRGRGRPPKTAAKSNDQSKSNVADSSEDEAIVPSFVVNSDTGSDNDTPTKSEVQVSTKPGPKSKKMSLVKESTPRGRGRPPKTLVKSNGRPKSKRIETSEDEAQASDSNVDSDVDTPIITPKTNKRKSTPNLTPPESSRRSRRSLANDKSDNDKSKEAEASSDDQNDAQSDDTPTKSPSKVTKRKADSSTAEKISRGPRVHWSKKPKKGDEDRYEVNKTAILPLKCAFY